MRKLLFFMLLFVNMFTVFSQEVCESPDESSEVDLNSISITKCAITPLKKSKDKKSRQIRVRVSARRRVLKKKATTSVNSLSASGVGSSSIKNATASIKNLSASQVGSSSIKEKTSDLSIATTNTSKEIKLKNNIEILKNRLSKEEVNKALRFTYVDRIPTFKGCEKAKKGERSDCFNTEMVSHISKHFNYPAEAVRSHLEGEVWVRFIIDKEGYVKNIKTLGPDNGEILNDEAIRVVSKLPRFKPAKKDGKRTSTKYGFPINFSLEE